MMLQEFSVSVMAVNHKAHLMSFDKRVPVTAVFKDEFAG